MKWPSTAFALHAYIVFFSLFIIWGSALTLLAAASGHHVHAGRGFVIGLASIELAAAAAFMFPRTRGIAGAVLVAIFTLACCLTLLHDGSFPAALLLDLATTLFILAMTNNLERGVK
jgi:hypothetical protein